MLTLQPACQLLGRVQTFQMGPILQDRTQDAKGETFEERPIESTNLTLERISLAPSGVLPGRLGSPTSRPDGRAVHS